MADAVKGPVGGRLKRFVSVWKERIKDPWAIHVIDQGLSLDLISFPYQDHIPEHILSSEDEKIVVEEIYKLIEKEAMKIKTNLKGFYNPIFVIPKKDGNGKRMILDCRKLNESVAKMHFKMESLATLRDLLMPYDWMMIIDIKDAYYHVPLAEAVQNFFSAKVGNLNVKYVAMPMGLTSSPRIWTKLMKPVLAIIRGNGIRIVIFIDDCIILGDSKESCQQNGEFVLRTFIQLGFLINWEKSKLIPSQEVEFLGMIINTVSMEFRVPHKKVQDIKNLAEMLLVSYQNSKEIPTRTVAQLLGKIAAVEMAVFPARLKSRSLLANKNNNLHKGWKGSMRLSHKAAEELKWWINHLDNWNGKFIILPTPSLTIMSDASKVGWGAINMKTGEEIHGFWSQLERKYGNNIRELLAGKMAAEAFHEDIEGKVFELQMDNTSAVSYIQKMGGKVQFLSNIAEDFWNFCLERKSICIPKYVPGKQNLADKPSRIAFDRNDWKLNPEIFRMLDNIWGMHQVDLFATRLNTQLPKFVSWKKEPKAWKVDAFSFPWKDINGWANPPFGLIARLLAKVKQEKCTITLIAPLWRTQPWFPFLGALCIDYPLILPNRQDLFLPGSLGNQVPMFAPSWKCAAFRISGNDQILRNFQHTLSVFSHDQEEAEHIKIMPVGGNSSQLGSMNSASLILPFHHLE